MSLDDKLVPTMNREIDSQHPDHLTKHQYSMAVLFEPRQEFVQENHFATIDDNVPQRLFFDVRAHFGAIKQEWVIARLLELHSNVEE